MTILNFKFTIHMLDCVDNKGYLKQLSIPLNIISFLKLNKLLTVL